MVFFDRPALVNYAKNPVPENLAILLIAYANFMANKGEFYVRGTKGKNGRFDISVVTDDDGKWLPVFTAEAECGLIGEGQMLGKMGARKALQNVLNTGEFCGLVINPFTMGIMLEREDVKFLEENS